MADTTVHNAQVRILTHGSYQAHCSCGWESSYLTHLREQAHSQAVDHHAAFCTC